MLILYVSPVDGSTTTIRQDIGGQTAYIDIIQSNGTEQGFSNVRLSCLLEYDTRKFIDNIKVHSRHVHQQYNPKEYLIAEMRRYKFLTSRVIAQQLAGEIIIIHLVNGQVSDYDQFMSTLWNGR